MKYSDLKELIKKSMHEVAPKGTSGAMTPEEEAMVAGYEEEQANKYALDNEKPLEEDILREADEIVAAYAKKKTLKEAGASPKYWVVAKDKRGELYVFNDGYYNTKEEANNAFKNISVPKIVDADTIKVQPVPTSPNYIGLFKNLSERLNEEMHGGYLELFEMNPAFEEGVSMLLTAWNEWKKGDMTEPYMVEEAKQDVLAYLSSMMK